MSIRLLPRLAASLAVVALAAPGAVLLAGATLGAAGPGTTTVDGVVATVVLLLGSAVLAWYALTAVLASVCLGTRLLGHGWRAGERTVRAAGAPLLRRVVTAGAGAAIAAGLVVAPVAAEPLTPERADVTVTREIPASSGLRTDLGWGAADDATTADDDGRTTEPTPPPAPLGDEDTAPDDPAEPSGTASPQEPASEQPTPEYPTDTNDATPAPEPEVTTPEPEPTTDPTDSTDATEPDDALAPLPGADVGVDATDGAVHVVLRGESLWAIAAGELGPGASPEQIAARWPQWFETNRDRIGPDPDVIHPGQELRAPADDLEEDA
jgi:resuscitation-promoting factor RpfA